MDAKMPEPLGLLIRLIYSKAGAFTPEETQSRLVDHHLIFLTSVWVFLLIATYIESRSRESSRAHNKHTFSDFSFILSALICFVKCRFDRQKKCVTATLRKNDFLRLSCCCARFVLYLYLSVTSKAHCNKSIFQPTNRTIQSSLQKYTIENEFAIFE